MTLSYEIRNEPPSQRALLSYGIVLLLFTGLVAIGAFIGLFTVIRTVGVGSAIVLVFSQLLHIVVYGWLAIDMMRARRWVRPATVGLAVLMLTALAATAPATLALFGGSTNIQVIAAASTFFGNLIFCGVLYGYFHHFRKEKTRETLEFFQSSPAWTDAWPMPVVALFFAAAYTLLTTATSVLSALASIATSATRFTGFLNLLIAVAQLIPLAMAMVAFRRHLHRRFFLLCRLALVLSCALSVIAVLVGGDWEMVMKDFNLGAFRVGTAIGGILRLVASLWVLSRIAPAFESDGAAIQFLTAAGTDVPFAVANPQPAPPFDGQPLQPNQR